MRTVAVGLLTLAVLVGISVAQYPYNPYNPYGGGGGGGGGGFGGGGFLGLIGLIFIILILFGTNRQRNLHFMYGNYTDNNVQFTTG